MNYTDKLLKEYWWAAARTFEPGEEKYIPQDINIKITTKKNKNGKECIDYVCFEDVPVDIGISSRDWYDPGDSDETTMDVDYSMEELCNLWSFEELEDCYIKLRAESEGISEADEDYDLFAESVIDELDHYADINSTFDVELFKKAIEYCARHNVAFYNEIAKEAAEIVDEDHDCDEGLNKKSHIVLKEAPDMYGIPTDDELEAEYNKSKADIDAKYNADKADAASRRAKIDALISEPDDSTVEIVIYEDWEPTGPMDDYAYNDDQYYENWFRDFGRKHNVETDIEYNYEESDTEDEWGEPLEFLTGLEFYICGSSKDVKALLADWNDRGGETHYPYNNLPQLKDDLDNKFKGNLSAMAKMNYKYGDVESKQYKDGFEVCTKNKRFW